MADPGWSRRSVLHVGLITAMAGAPGCAGAADSATLVHSARPGAAFRVDAFNIAGVFDADWLPERRYARLLDTMAASPGAFGTVRFFGVLNAGERETVFPTSSGRVWASPDAPMDFSASIAALDTLVRRGITPFVGLTFFPRAVSPGPVTPPSDYAAWQRLVRGFLDAITARFGAAEVARWWFEAWNEPNMPPFWGGSFDQYLGLYRATSEAVIASGHTIRLGGPVLAYMPDEGAALMQRFISMLGREPGLKCDFVSMHRKGVWVADEREPRLARLEAAARDTADALLRLAPGRARGMVVVNDEADMRVAFNTPYEPRMTQQFPSWLAASAIMHERLSAEYTRHGIRFMAAADHANQHLIQGPFDGRRSVMTPLSADPADLVKLPVFNFHEMLRLLGHRHGTVVAERLPSGVFHLVTAGEGAVAALLTHYPDRSAETVDLDYTLQDLPWPQVNLARFGIGAALSSSFAAAGGVLDPRVTDPARVRAAAELGVTEPIRSALMVEAGTLRLRLRLAPFDTVLVWVTPTRPQRPAAPDWLQAEAEGGNAVLRWTPGREESVYTYEVRRNGRPISPVPLRAAMWIDAAPPPGRHSYSVRAVSASGVAGAEIRRQLLISGGT